MTQAPDGRTWAVRRRWIPRLGAETVWGRFRRRIRQSRRRATKVTNADTGFFDVFGEAIAIGVLALLAVLAIVFLGIPLLLAVIDVALIVLLGVATMVTRVVFRRPWIVEARADDGTTSVWRVVGWRSSGERIEEIRQVLAAGIEPTPDAPGPAAAGPA